MNHIFGCPMHYGVGAPGLINSLDYLQSFCPELDIDILPEITRPEENLSNLKEREVKGMNRPVNYERAIRDGCPMFRPGLSYNTYRGFLCWLHQLEKVYDQLYRKGKRKNNHRRKSIIRYRTARFQRTEHQPQRIETQGRHRIFCRF